MQLPDFKGQYIYDQKLDYKAQYEIQGMNVREYLHVLEEEMYRRRLSPNDTSRGREEQMLIASYRAIKLLHETCQKAYDIIIDGDHLSDEEERERKTLAAQEALEKVIK